MGCPREVREEDRHGSQLGLFSRSWLAFRGRNGKVADTNASGVIGQSVKGREGGG